LIIVFLDPNKNSVANNWIQTDGRTVIVSAQGFFPNFVRNLRLWKALNLWQLTKALQCTMESHFQNLNKYLCTSSAIQILGYKCGSSIISICAFLDTFAKFSSRHHQLYSVA
jgi:hypothetical protein